MRKVLYIVWPSIGLAKWALIAVIPQWALTAFIVVGIGIGLSAFCSLLPGAVESTPWKKRKKIHVTST